MCIYALTEEIVFPDPELANSEGLLAVGGDLSVDRILNAYYNGIFPWYGEGDPILWWSPDPRMIIETNNFKPSKSLKQSMRQGKFEQRIDTQFEEVLRNCRNTERKDQDGTWIDDKIESAYTELYNQGFAHSFETYYNDELVGGLYGLLIGKMFFGESMFQTKSNASKMALVDLVETCKNLQIPMIDCQQETAHLKSMGAINISRKDFVARTRELCLKKAGIDSKENEE